MNTSNSFGALEFQYVSRKSKGKKKRKKPARNVEENSETSDTVDVENELEYTNVNEDDDSEDINESDQLDVTHDSEHRRITTDAQLKTKPTVQEETLNEKEQENSSESPGSTQHSLEETGETFNVRALPKHAETYELEKFQKNALLIFNQINVDGFQRPRHGTEKDIEVLTNTFERFGFDVKEHTDLTKKEIFDELKTFCKRDFTDYGCVGVAVLSHGSTRGLINAKDQQYSELEIIDEFKVHDKPTLVTKPKFLIIQACRGMLQVPGATVLRAGKVRLDQEVSVEPYILPVEADMLILHSSFVGTPSHRDELLGSWFVQSLCNKINELSASHDIESIMIVVKRDVATEKEDEIYNKSTRLMQVNKQMPVMTSTLTRKLYFKKFGDPPFVPLVTMTVNQSPCNSGSRTELDAPATPMLVQFGPCSCFLEHFEYIKNCYRYYLEDFPEDDIAQDYLEVAETLEEGVQFNAAKEKISKAMCKHLVANARHAQYYKYLYFYKHFSQL